MALLDDVRVDGGSRLKVSGAERRVAEKAEHLVRVVLLKLDGLRSESMGWRLEKRRAGLAKDGGKVDERVILIDAVEHGRSGDGRVAATREGRRLGRVELGWARHVLEGSRWLDGSYDGSSSASSYLGCGTEGRATAATVTCEVEA